MAKVGFDIVRLSTIHMVAIDYQMGEYHFLK